MGRALRLLFLAAGVAFMATACARALDDGRLMLPSWPVLAGAVGVAASGMLAAAAGWVALVGGRVPRRVAGAGFLAAQLGKYIPGGVWAGVGQIGFVMAAGLPAGRAGGVVASYAVVLVAAAGAVAGVAGLAAGTSPWVPAVCLALPILLHRRWLAGSAERLGGWIPRRLGALSIPAQRHMLWSFAWLVPSIACSALTFALLLRAGGIALPLPVVVSSYAVAWLAGFLALGLPSGIGAREAALLALLDGGVGPLVAVSVVHRLVQATAEALLLLACRRHVPGSPTDAVETPVGIPHHIPSTWRSP